MYVDSLQLNRFTLYIVVTAHGFFNKYPNILNCGPYTKFKANVVQSQSCFAPQISFTYIMMNKVIVKTCWKLLPRNSEQEDTIGVQARLTVKERT